MLKVIQWCKKEMIRLIPAILYFLICFNLFHFAQGLMMQPTDIRFTSYLGATLGALLAGKVIIIVETMPFINAFPNKPIIYNIIWKFVIYSFFVLLVQILDYIVQGLYHTKHWSTTYAHLKMDLAQSLFWGVQISVLMFFLIFIVFSELVRVIGETKMKKIFFG